jgi:hypothetical protein
MRENLDSPKSALTRERPCNARKLRGGLPRLKIVVSPVRVRVDVDGSFQARVVSVEQVGDAAFAVLEEDGFWGTVSFTDFFTLARIDGAWKIVNKTFAHTGGEPPEM